MMSQKLDQSLSACDYFLCFIFKIKIKYIMSFICVVYCFKLKSTKYVQTLISPV